MTTTAAAAPSQPRRSSTRARRSNSYGGASLPSADSSISPRPSRRAVQFSAVAPERDADDEDADEDADEAADQMDAYFHYEPSRRLTSLQHVRESANLHNLRGSSLGDVRDSQAQGRRKAASVADAIAAMLPGQATSSSPSRRRRSSTDWLVNGAQLSRAQQQGCFSYIKRRHSIALAFAADDTPDVAEAGATSGGDVDASPNASPASHHSDEGREPSNISPLDAADGEGGSGQSNWEFTKTKMGVRLFKSRRSRCEVRGVTLVNASVKNVMSLLAAGESSEAFAHAQRVLVGNDQLLDAKVLASCVPASTSRYFHCGLKYQAIKNPFGATPLDLVYLDYTDVSTTPDDKLLGYRIVESIRVPELRPLPKFTRASIRCEVYIVRETAQPGVVEVTFASHLDPKSKFAPGRRANWLDQAAARLANLRAYAEKASFSHRLLLEKSKLDQRAKVEHRRACTICQHNFSFLRKRHSCRLCGDVSCGRCCRKLPILVDTETTRVKVCLGCILESRRHPDELGRGELAMSERRGELGNSTFIIHDE